MILDDPTRSTGEWLRGEGPLAEVVISSRVRLARNITQFPFLTSASTGQKSEIFRTIADQVIACADDPQAELIDVKEADDLDRQVLVERHLISRQQADAEGSRGVTVWPDETLAIMINEEDHLRIQGLRSGLRLDELWTRLSALDDKLGARLEYAYDKKFGFLTACPTNVGTGIRVSVMLHLPALKLSQEIERVSRATKALQLAVRGLHGEGTEAVGDLVQISNQTTLGKSEEEIIKSLGETVIPRIVEYERLARDELLKQHAEQIDDRIWRAYGVLSQARCIGTEETLTMLSHLRMGIHMGRFDLIDIRTLNELFLLTQPAHLQKMVGRLLEGRERAIARADYLRKRLSE